MGVPDRNGKNDYDRPVLIVTSNADIAAGCDLYGIVCSSSSANRDPRPHYFIALPFQPQGAVRTKLKRSTVAICTWVIRINPSDIKSVGGTVPLEVMELIIDKARECRELGITDT